MQDKERITRMILHIEKSYPIATITHMTRSVLIVCWLKPVFLT